MTAVAVETLDTEVGRYLAADPALVADPFPLFRRLREEAPVFRHGSVVVLTRYDDVRQAYQDGVNFTKHTRSGGISAASRAALDDELAARWDEIARFSALFMTHLDGAEHRRVRFAAHRAFTPRRMASLQAAMRGDAEELLRPVLEEGGGDLVPFAYRLPLLTLMRMLGIPAADREAIHRWSEHLTIQLGDLEGTEPEMLRRAHTAKTEFCAYLEAMAADRPPGDADLLGDLLGAGADGRLSTEELTAMFVVLLVAGHETTTALIANGMIELLQRPEQWRLLCAERERIPSAVEELLRFVSPVLHNPRLSATEIELGGERIPAGMTVVPIVGAANRDPAAFDNPEELDVTRDARRHLAFGYGEHFCIGNQLARQEAIAAFAVLAERAPGIEAVDDDYDWFGTSMLRRPRRLDVRIGAF